MKTYKEYSIIVKPFRYDSSSYGVSSNCNGKGSIIIDTANDTIDIDIMSGPDPYVKDIILFVLSDRHVRLMIKNYQQSYKRNRPYALRASTGSSGRQDIYINYYNSYGLQTGGKKLLHKSSFDKLNEGWAKMWVGDFVELVAFLMEQSGADYDLTNRRKLRKLSECHYVRGYFSDDATKNISKII